MRPKKCPTQGDAQNPFFQLFNLDKLRAPRTEPCFLIFQFKKSSRRLAGIPCFQSNLHPTYKHPRGFVPKKWTPDRPHSPMIFIDTRFTILASKFDDQGKGTSSESAAACTCHGFGSSEAQNGLTMSKLWRYLTPKLIVKFSNCCSGCGNVRGGVRAEKT